ncbi:MAG TPA: hypothetical protein VF614_18210 [Chthoniobacteraceae bacterium]
MVPLTGKFLEHSGGAAWQKGIKAETSAANKALQQMGGVYR